MQDFVAVKLQEFEQGKITRRGLVEALTLAATTGVAEAAEQKGINVSVVNHLSYTNPNYRQGADWYSMLFNLPQVNDDGANVNLPFGNVGDKPLGITRNDVGPTFIVSRTRDLNGVIGATGVMRQKATCVVDHVAYTIADFDGERVKAELKSMGVQNVRDGGKFSVHMADPFGFDVELCGLENNSLTDGA